MAGIARLPALNSVVPRRQRQRAGAGHSPEYVEASGETTLSPALTWREAGLTAFQRMSR